MLLIGCDCFMRAIYVERNLRTRINKWDIRLRGAKVYFAGEKGLGSRESYREFLAAQGATAVEKLTDKPNVIVVGTSVGIPDDVINYVSGGTKSVDAFIFNEDQLQDALSSKSARFWERAIIYFSEDTLESKYEDEVLDLDSEIVDKLSDGPNMIIIKGKRGKLGSTVLNYIAENRNKIMLWGEGEFNDVLNRQYDEHTSPDILARSRPLKAAELNGARILYTSLNELSFENARRLLTEEFGVKTVRNQLDHYDGVTGQRLIKQASGFDFMIWNGAEKKSTIVLKWSILANMQTGKPEIIRSSDFIAALEQAGWEVPAHGAKIRELEGPHSPDRAGSDVDVWDNDLPKWAGVFIVPGVFKPGPRNQFYKYMKSRGIECMETLPDDPDDMPQIMVVKNDSKISAKEREYLDQVPGAEIVGVNEFFTLLYKDSSRNHLTAVDPDFDWTALRGKTVVYMLGNSFLSLKNAEKHLKDTFGVRKVLFQLQPGYTGKNNPVYCAFVDPRRNKAAGVGRLVAWEIPLVNTATLRQAFVEAVPGFNPNILEATDDRKPEGRPPQSQIGGGTRDVKDLARTRGVNSRDKRNDPYRRTRDLAPDPNARNRSRGRSGLAGEVNNPPPRRRSLR